MKNKALLGLISSFVIALTLYFFLSQEGKSDSSIHSDLGSFSQASFKEVKDHYFLLHFWAKWCEPCIDEIPHLVQFARLMNEGKSPDGKPLQLQKPLKILAVSLDPTLEESKQILPNQGRDLPPNFLLALDADHQFAEKMGSYQYPETYLVNPSGVIIEKWVGIQKWLQPQVFEFFRQKLL